MDDPASFGAWLRATRRGYEQTQVAASKAIGVHQVTYARWETDARAPRLHLLEAIAKWAKCKPSTGVRVLGL